jgi:membrane associated rhomboid family serine protease
MREASVGHQCVECVRDGSKTMRTAQAVFGGKAVSTPWVTWVLLAVNIGAYGAENLFHPWVVNNLAMDSLSVGYLDQWWRLITGAFLHYPLAQGGFGITHILFNMWALYVIGPELERRLGSLRFAVLYLLSALGGSVAIYLFGYAAVGASGAIYGLFGALFVVSRRLGFDPRGVLWLIGINVAITFLVPGISWQGHLGGLVTGVIVAAALVYAPKKNRDAVQLVAAAVICAALVLTVLLLPPITAMSIF